MPHKFVPRKGLNRKAEPEAEEPTSESPPPPPPAPAPDEAAAEDAPSAPPTKDSKESILSKGRSTKESILKRLTGRKPAPAEEPDEAEPEVEDAPSAPPAKQPKESILKGRSGKSAKDSLLKKLPTRGGPPRSRPRFEPTKRAAIPPRRRRAWP